MVLRRMLYLISDQENDFPSTQTLIANLRLKPLTESTLDNML